MGQSIFSNALIATFGRVLTLICGLVATALMARMLRVEEFGIYSLVLTVAILLQLASDFGLYLTASRELGVSGGESNHVIANIASLRLALLGAIFGLGAVVYMSAPFLRPQAALFIILSCGLILQSLSQLLMGIFQAYGSVWRATAGDVAGRVVQVLLLLFIASQGNATLLAIAGAFTGGLLIAWCIHMLLIPNKSLLTISISLSIWKYIARRTWPIALLLVLNAIYFRIDTVILSFLTTSQEVGWYSLSYKVIENGLFFPAMLGGLLLPPLSAALNTKSMDRARQLLSESLALSFSGAVFVTIILSVFSSEIIEIIAGPSFRPSASLLAILGIALGIMCLGNIFGFCLIALGQQRRLLMLYTMLVVFNICANLLFIPSFGALAAAWSTVATEAIATLVAGTLVYTHVRWSVPTKKICTGIIIAAVACAISYFIVPTEYAWVRLGAAAAVYVVAGWGFGIWSKKSLVHLRSAQSL
jgi:O-antigen/teichoic acid export membrane protein